MNMGNIIHAQGKMLPVQRRRSIYPMLLMFVFLQFVYLGYGQVDRRNQLPNSQVRSSSNEGRFSKNEEKMYRYTNKT